MKHSLLFVILFTFFTARAQIITTVAGGGSSIPGNGGPATACALSSPSGIAVDASGNLYICDRNEHRVRKVTPAGVISTIAGTGVPGTSGNGGPATAALLYQPYCIAVSADAIIYIGDQSGVRKINTSGIITLFAGTTVQGYNGDGILATNAQLSVPGGIATDAIGNVYISDVYNHRIRKVDTAGYITTIAGTGTAGYSGNNGLATAAKISSPTGIQYASDNNIYIADYLNHCVRKIDPSGIITTIAGNGIAGFSGDNDPATAAALNGPINTATDTLGNLYITDGNNHTIRKVDPLGVITTFAGQPSLSGFSGDGGPATAAKFNGPTGIAISNSGDMYISDYSNFRIRLISNTVLSTSSHSLSLTDLAIYPVPTHGHFTIHFTTSTSVTAKVVITDLQGRVVHQQLTQSNAPTSIVTTAPTGIYFISVHTHLGTITKELTIVK